MVLSHSAEILLKGLQEVYSHFSNENGDTITLSSCMPFTTLSYLITSNQSALLACGMIQDVDDSFRMDSDPVNDVLGWCRTKQMFPPMDRNKYDASDINKLEVFKFILQYLRIRRLRDLPEMDHLPLYTLTWPVKGTKDDEFPVEKLTKLMNKDILDLDSMKANLSKPMVPKQLNNTRIPNTIWEASDILNMAFNHRWIGIKSRFQATLACLIWKIVDPVKRAKQDSLVEVGAVTITESLNEARGVMKPLRGFYVWDSLNYLLPSSEKLDCITRVGDKLPHQQGMFRGQFRSLPALSTVPDRGGMLEGLSKDVVNQDVRKANSRMRQGNPTSKNNQSPKRGSNRGGNSPTGESRGASGGAQPRGRVWGRGGGTAAPTEKDGGYANQDPRNLIDYR